MKVWYNVDCVGRRTYIEEELCLDCDGGGGSCSNIKILVERVLEWVNGSWRVPAVEVAPVSLTADGMEPLLIPSLMVRGDMWVDVLRMLIVPVCLSG